MKIPIFIVAISFLYLSFESFGQGSLMITPTRVVFDGTKQKELLSLVNSGKDTATYFISFVQKNMQEDGSFVNIENPEDGQMSAEPFLRIFPRKVTLAPGEPQAIMLQCMANGAMPAGEYRSHLFFRAEQLNKPLGLKNETSDSTQISIQLIPVFGISIPIIVRSGIVDVTSTLSDLKLDIMDTSLQNIKFTINRKGNISLYGDISIEFIPSLGKSFFIGAANGVGVYTNIDKRNMAVKINNTSGKALKNGKYRVRYTSSGDAKPVVYAEADLIVKK